MKELEKKYVKVMQKYIDLFFEKNKDNVFETTYEQLCSHTNIEGTSVGAYLTKQSVGEDKKYHLDYSVLRFAGIEYNFDRNSLEVAYEKGQIPCAIDLFKWLDAISKRLDGKIHEQPKQSDFYLNGDSVRVVTNTVEKVDEASIAKAQILDELLSRSKVILEK